MEFTGLVEEIRGVLLVRLGLRESAALPARGMVMGEGLLNGVPFLAPLEPDGRQGHWLEISPALAQKAGIKPGDQVALSLQPAFTWPEPPLPQDLGRALSESGLMETWDSLTTKARWEWLRWVRSTNNPATRQKRVTVAMDKLSKGDRRPCCFNTASCTLPQVSKSGVLLSS